MQISRSYNVCIYAVLLPFLILDTGSARGQQTGTLEFALKRTYSFEGCSFQQESRILLGMGILLDRITHDISALRECMNSARLVEAHCAAVDQTGMPPPGSGGGRDHVIAALRQQNINDITCGATSDLKHLAFTYLRPDAVIEFDGPWL